MPARLRLYDVRTSRAAQAVGLCQGDLADVADDTNSAIRRLLYCKEAGDEGWWGTWAEVNFNVSQTNPFITTPREIARLEAITVCQRPVQIRNQFYEYLTFGNGKMPKIPPWCSCRNYLQTYARNVVPSFFDLTNPPQQIRVSLSDPSDVGKRVFVQGLDNNGVQVVSRDVFAEVQGVFVTLGLNPTLATNPDGSTVLLSVLTGLQKDITNGQIKIEQVSLLDGSAALLSTIEPSETVTGYRRYQLDPLPPNCCNVLSSATTVQVTALAKLEFIPVMVDPDYCLIGNLEAIIEEMMAIRYSTMDTIESKNLEGVKHKAAVAYLNGELNHYQGRDTPAATFKPYGSARLDHWRIGRLM